MICPVDLAMTKWGSPANDLAYFFCLSTTRELRQSQLEDFLEFYHTKLTSYLHKLGVDPSIYTYR